MFRTFIEKHAYKIIFGVAIVGILCSLFLGAINGQIEKIEFSDYRTDAEIYNMMALSLIGTGSPYDSNGNYYGSLRAPGYPYFLSFAYSLYRSPVSAWVLQVVFFILSIFLMWGIAKHFLKGSNALLPPLIFSLSWFVCSFVIRLNSDFLGMFWVLLGTWSLLEYVLGQKQRTRHNFFSVHTLLALSAVSFALAALARPVMLYFIVFLGIYICVVNWRHAFFYSTLFLITVVPPIALNYYLFGAPVLSDSGVVIAMRGRVLLLEDERLRAFMIASVFGDLVADQYLQGYKDNPEPYPAISAVAKERTIMRDSGIPFQKMNSQFLTEGLDLFRAHPIKFFITGIFNFIHLHNPPNHDGVLMTHFLAEKETISLPVRILLNVAVRIVWFLSLAVVLWGAVVCVHDKNTRLISSLLLIVMMYTVAMHAFLSHAEFRFLLPAIPFYILFFIVGGNELARRFTRKCS